MFSIARGLGVGALVTAGFGFGVTAPPPPPTRPPSVVVSGGSGGGGAGRPLAPGEVEFGGYAADDASDRRPASGPQTGGAADLGVRYASWRGDELLTGGASDAGTVLESWDDPLRSVTAGGTDAGTLHETWTTGDGHDKA